MLKLQSSLKAACMAVAALTALSCSQDDLTDQSALKGNTTIVASFEEVDTRTSVNDKNEVVWEKDDAFGLFYTANSKNAPKVAQFSCSTADGTSTSASFSGTLDDDVTTSYAVYPYDKNMSLSGSTVTMELPAEFKYTKASNGPMYVSASNISNKLQFKHLAGLLKLTVSKGIDAKAKKFVITADKNIAGTCTADLSTTYPTLTVSPNGDKTITVNLDIKTAGSMTFYIPIPTGTYATLSAQLLDSDGKALHTPKEWTDITVARAGMLTASFGYITIDAGTPAGINKAVADALPKEAPETPTTTNFELSGAIDATQESTPIIIPAMKNSNVELSLANIPATTVDKPLELTAENSTETPAAAVNTLTVAIPKVGNDQTAPNITITMPKTTVELTASGTEGTTYGKIIAKTATSTLIVKAGVTVKELVIAGGNVEIYGTVEKLSKDDSNKAESITVTSGGAANIKTVENTDSKFKISSTWDGTSKVAPTDNKIYTAAQLAYYQSTSIPVSSAGKDLTATMTAATTLCADIDLNDKPWIGMVLGGDVAFDGGNHTISKVLVTEHVLSENGIYTPAACVGLFAATKPSSTIKDITVDGFTAKDAGANAKWNGALVGYSYGTSSYNNCHAKNVKIESESADAYRIGGLIGFIGSVSGTDVEVTLANCSATDVTIKGSFCIGGLVGSLQGGTRNFNTCTVSNAKLSINKNSSALKGAWSGETFYAPYKFWAGYMSMFIGEANCNTINIDSNCSIANNAKFTAEELKSFGYDDIAEYKYAKNATPDEIASAQSKANHYRLQDGNSFLPACVDKGTIKVGSTTLALGTDYNKFTLTKAGNGSAEGYDKTEGSWADKM